MDEKPRPATRGGVFSERNLQLGLVIVLFALAGVVAIVWVRTMRGYAARRAGGSVLPESDPIWDSWRAAEAGDVEKYLACFTGAARRRLDDDLAGLGRERFKQRLLDQSAAVDGSPQLCQPKPSDDESVVIFPVVLSHGEERELSDYLVVKVGKAWKIRAVVPHGRIRLAPPEEEPPTKQGDKK